MEIAKKPSLNDFSISILGHIDRTIGLIVLVELLKESSSQTVISNKNIIERFITGTSKGVMTNKEAAGQKLGGEVICYVY